MLIRVVKSPPPSKFKLDLHLSESDRCRLQLEFAPPWPGTFKDSTRGRLFEVHVGPLEAPVAFFDAQQARIVVFLCHPYVIPMSSLCHPYVIPMSSLGI